MYQRQGQAAYKPNLDNTLALASYLGHPENDFKSIHVAGTNGKGSTSHMLASIFQEAGYAVGLYTSPHLKDFRERIKINGTLMPEAYVCEFVNEHQMFFKEHQLSFFEMTVGLAFDYFSKQKVDIAVIEVGMGGRLDSTNIITPELSVITNIGLDHTQFLGNTLAQIAKEKAGIIKAGIPVVIGEFQEDTVSVFREVAEDKQSKLYIAEGNEFPEYPSDLKGSYQTANRRTVLQSVEVLKACGWEIPETAIRSGLAHVIDNTGLQGRWQVLQQQPKVICDTAHNKEGLRYVMQQLAQEDFDRLHIVLGVVSDKDLHTILPLFPSDATYYFCKPDIARGMPASELQKIASGYALDGEVFHSVNDAFNEARSTAATHDLIFVGGSTFVVAEVV